MIKPNAHILEKISADEYREIVSAKAGKRRNKFNAKPVTIDGIRFDSTGEATRWATLQLLECQNLIANLERQKVYPLHALGGEQIGKFIADFAYFDVASNAFVVEDFKSPATAREATFRRNCRHMRAEYGITVKITGRSAPSPDSARAAR